MITIAMIPARIGSTRLKMKNMALLGGRSLISYAIEAAKASGVFDRVIINGDHEVFRRVAGASGVEFYLRPEALGSSTTTSDEVVYDFMLQHPSDVVAWVNPTSPLQTGEEIRSVVEAFRTQGLDSLITVKDERVHCVMDGAAVNFDPNGRFARTQDLTPVQPCVYSVMMWRTATFLAAFRERGYALLSGKVGYVPVSKRSAIIVKTPEDLMIAEAVLQATRGSAPSDVQYDAFARDLVKGVTS